MRRGVWLGLAAGAILGLWGGWSASAAAAPKPAAEAKAVLPRLDPPGHWRRMTQDPATTTSRCVGHPVTPMCAVDTYEACFIRSDSKLCDIALGLAKPSGLAFDKPWIFPEGWEKYRVVFAARRPMGPLSPRRRAFYDTWHKSRFSRPWPPGYVRIRLEYANCSGARCTVLSRRSIPKSYLLRPTPTGWAVVPWSAPPAQTNSDARLVLPRPDPPGHWRYMTVNPAKTTSRCVGSTATPMCAVDTLEACSYRSDDRLCTIAMGLDKPAGMVLGKPEPVDWEKYRVISALRKPTGPLTPRQRTFFKYWNEGSSLPHPWPPGDVRIVRQRVDCRGSQCGARRVWDRPAVDLLKPTPTGWIVVDWFTPCPPGDFGSACPD